MNTLAPNKPQAAEVIGLLAAALCTRPDLVRAAPLGSRMLVLCTAEKQDQKRIVGSGGQNIDSLIEVAGFLGITRPCFKLIEPVEAHSLEGEAPELPGDVIELARAVFEPLGPYRVDGQTFAEGALVIVEALPGATPIPTKVQAAFLHLFHGIARRMNPTRQKFELNIEWT